MNRRDLTYHAIRRNLDWVTNVDDIDLHEDYCLRLRGFRNIREGMIGERDYGTQHRLATYPIHPNVRKVITDATNATPIVITAAGHGYNNGDVVWIQGVVGNTAANCKYTIANKTTDTFELVGSVGSGTYLSGGIVTKTPISIIDGVTLYDARNATDYELMAGLDSSNNLRVYVHDSTPIELTRTVKAQIDAIDEGTVATASITFGAPVANDTITVKTNFYEFTYVAAAPGANEFSTIGELTTLINTIPGITATDNGTVVTVNAADPGTFGNDYFLALGGTNTGTMAIANVSGGSTSTPGAQRLFEGGTDPSITLTNITDALNNAITLTANELQYYSIKNTSDPNDKTGFVITNTSTVVSLRLAPTAVLGYAVGNNLVFYRTAGLMDYVFSNGTTPHIRWHTISAQGKAMFLYGNSDAVPTMQVPLVIRRLTASRTLFNDAATEVIQDAGWYAEQSQLIDKSAEVGSPSATKGSGDGDVVSTIGEGVKITCDFSAGALAKVSRVLVTAVYDYQESDPILKVHLSASTKVDLKFAINPGEFNRNLTGFNVYVATPPDGVSSAADWTDATGEYVLDEEISLSTSVWGQVYNSEYCYTITAVADPNDRATKLADGAETFAERFNRGYLMTRARAKPRYIIQLENKQGAAVVIDEDDTTLRVSHVNGSVVNEDESFPQLNADDDNRKLRLTLSGQGKALGLGVSSGRVAVLRTAQIEFYDLQTGFQGLYPADVGAPRSILYHDFGLSWGGRYGYYLLPRGGGSIVNLTKPIGNFYDGSLKIDNGITTQYVTDAYRQAAIAGYDPAYRRLLLHIQANRDTADGGGSEYLTLAYSFDEGKWHPRKFNLGGEPVKYFTRRSDGTLTIGYRYGILAYPIKTGSTAYQDDVLLTGAGTLLSQSRGFETSILINIGSISGLASNFVLYEILIDKRGSSVSGTGQFTLKLLGNNNTSPWDTRTINIDSKCFPIQVKPAGQRERLVIEFSLPTNALEDFKNFDLSNFELGIKPQVRIGP